MSTQKPSKPIHRREFEIGIICALSLEADMVEMVFDERWDKDGIDYGRSLNDPNAYTTGIIAGRNVVLAYCPDMGSNGAAQVATWLMASFTGIKIVLVAGICGAVPSYRQQEHGPSTFVRKDGLQALGRASLPIRTMLTKLQTRNNRLDLNKDLISHLQTLQNKHPTQAIYPGTEEDRLCRSIDRHTHQSQDELCEKCNVQLGICSQICKNLGCEDRYTEYRRRLGAGPGTPSIHFGYFGSSNTVLKSGLDRDRLARDNRIIAFEMEGSGVWDLCPTVVIKAVCDYADSHKSKKWQAYAAAVAAAGLKAFIPKLQFLSEESLSTDIIRHEQSNLRSTKPTHMIPFLRNPRFTGREDVLRELEVRLLTQKTCHKLAIYGLGGVGKTQVALEFCYLVKSKYTDYSIFWASTMSQARFMQDIREIARKCNVGAGCKEDDLLSIVQTYLTSEESGKWLLIVDNADDSSILFDEERGIFGSLPQNMEGVVLFTTRYKDMAVDLADGDIVDIERMRPEEARLFLKRSLRQDYLVQDEEEVDHLLEELTYLPLAIVQASSYIIKTSITILKYLDLLRRTESEAIKLLAYSSGKNSQKRGSSHDAVAMTWLITFERIRDEEPRAADVLFFLALLENKSIPRSIIPKIEPEVDLTNTIGTLIGYSFLIAQDNDGKLYDMHRLVHLAIRNWMQKEGILGYWREKAISHLADLLSPLDWLLKSAQLQYIPHAIRLLQDIGHEQPVSRELIDLHLSLSDYLIRDSRVAKALEYIHKGIQLLKRWPSTNLESKVTACSLLGNTFAQIGLIKEALMLLEKTVEVAAEMLAEDDPARLTTQLELGSVLLEDGHYERAVKVIKEVVDIRKRILPEEHPARLISEHKLGTAYLWNGQMEQAIRILERVAANHAWTFAEDDIHFQLFRQTLAEAYLWNNQVRKAVEMLEEVNTVFTKSFGEEHPYLLAVRHELGKAYLTDKQIKKATEMLEKVVMIRDRILTANHPAKLVSQTMLARAYLDNHQTTEALALLKDVVAIRLTTSSEEHPALLQAKWALSRAYKQNGQLKEAIELLEQVFTISRRTLPEEDRDRLSVQFELGCLYIMNHRYHEGYTILQEYVAIRAKQSQGDDPKAQLQLQQTMAMLDELQIRFE